MYRRDDPRLRRTLNQLSQNLESANESAQAGLYTFTQNYIDPCISSIGNCFQACTDTYFPNREERLRRSRARSRGRPELSFDFYDDWENEENDGLLGWGNDELDRLLAGAAGYGTTTQPSRERGMSYGIRRDARAARRKSAVQPHDGGPDPTIIPSSSYFGFLGRLPWNFGGKGLRYKPSAADLREHPGIHRETPETEPLIEESGDDEEVQNIRRQHRRKRSETAGSGHTTDSLSSRGDIFPSEDEIDDAVPLDDEFASALERRTTGLTDENIIVNSVSTKRGSRSRLSIRTMSSRSTNSRKRTRGSSVTANFAVQTPDLTGLKQEVGTAGEGIGRIERKTESTKKLAIEHRPKSSTNDLGSDCFPAAYSSISPQSPPVSKVQIDDLSTPTYIHNTDTFPFPAFDPHAIDCSSVDGNRIEASKQRRSSLEATQTQGPECSPPKKGFIPAKLPNFSYQNT